MASSTNESAANIGKFHPKCGESVTLSKDRRTANPKMASKKRSAALMESSKAHPKCGKDRRTARGPDPFLPVLYVAFSNDPIPKGLKFSVKILQKGGGRVSPISASSRPHTLDAPYMAGGAVHVIHCCLLFVWISC